MLSVVFLCCSFPPCVTERIYTTAHRSSLWERECSNATTKSRRCGGFYCKGVYWNAVHIHKQTFRLKRISDGNVKPQHVRVADSAHFQWTFSLFFAYTGLTSPTLILNWDTDQIYCAMMAIVVSSSFFTLKWMLYQVDLSIIPVPELGKKHWIWHTCTFTYSFTSTGSVD